jgi:hypothetical protein
MNTYSVCYDVAPRGLSDDELIQWAIDTLADRGVSVLGYHVRIDDSAWFVIFNWMD